MKKLNSVAIIPARYGSSRFPGKPLAKLCGKEIILHVCAQVEKSGILPVVATDDERILKCVEDEGYQAILTSTDHKSGTDRIREALDKMESEKIDVVINVQGDEPFINPSQLKALEKVFEDKDIEIATLIRKLPPENGIENLLNPNLVKVVKDKDNNALYFSRHPIPYVRGVEPERWFEHADFFSHVGVYAYRPTTLRKITDLPQGKLEKNESLEQLRWLEAGIPILTVETEGINVGIDTPEDLIEAEKIAQKM